MKVFTGMLMALFAASNALASNVYVREASVGRSGSSNRSDLTRAIRDTVRAHSSDRLVGGEDRADATLLPRLAGDEGNYTLTIERIEGGRTAATVERSAASLSEINALAPQATLAALSASGSSYAAADSGTSGGQSRSSTRGTSRGGGIFGPGHVQVGLGPAFASGMNADNVMYNATLAYLWDVNPEFAAKVIGEGNFGSGSDNGRMMDVSVGGDAYINRGQVFGSARPFVSGTLGLGTARNQVAETNTGITAGVGAGFRFATDAPQTVDVLVHYKLMTATVAGANPSVLGLRAAVNF